MTNTDTTPSLEAVFYARIEQETIFNSFATAFGLTWNQAVSHRRCEPVFDIEPGLNCTVTYYRGKITLVTYAVSGKRYPSTSRDALIPAALRKARERVRTERAEAQERQEAQTRADKQAAQEQADWISYLRGACGGEPDEPLPAHKQLKHFNNHQLLRAGSGPGDGLRVPLPACPQARARYIVLLDAFVGRHLGTGNDGKRLQDWSEKLAAINPLK